jgi:hypothetical protein
MPKHLLIFLLLALLAGSCAPAPASPTPLTSTVTPTTTPSPAPSATPTITLQTHERLLVTRDDGRFAVFSADGSLYKSIQAPSDIYMERFVDAISPDGNWLAYEHGSSIEEPYDRSLNLLNLDDGTSELVANLISPDFPENVEPILKTISQYDQSLYEGYCDNDIECLRSLVRWELAVSVGDYEWSPDGKLLAFTAQIDGPSTDIYIYSLQEKTICRLTDDLQNVDWIEWSPDGKRLLYENNTPGLLYERPIFHVTDLEGRTFQLSPKTLPDDGRWIMYGWISNNLYLFQALYDEQPQHRQLAILNVENQQLQEIWSYGTSQVAVNWDNETIMISLESDPDPNAPEPGTYFISTQGEHKKISNQVFADIISSPQIIGISTKDRSAYHILSDGSVRRIGPADLAWGNSSSPNKQWFFIEYKESEGRYSLTLYNDAYQPVNSWMFHENLMGATWRPDSSRIFLFTMESVYYLGIPDGKPRLLDVDADCDSIACRPPEFTWLP